MARWIGLGLLIMQIGINGYEESKDKEALSNMLIISKDSISSRAILQHNQYPFTDTFIYTLLYLPSTTHASMNKRAANTILTALVCCGRGLNTWPAVPQADALPLELSGPVLLNQGLGKGPVIILTSFSIKRQGR